jgi:hypothetical protein
MTSPYNNSTNGIVNVALGSMNTENMVVLACHFKEPITGLFNKAVHYLSSWLFGHPQGTYTFHSVVVPYGSKNLQLEANTTIGTDCSAMNIVNHGPCATAGKVPMGNYCRVKMSCPSGIGTLEYTYILIRAISRTTVAYITGNSSIQYVGQEN